MRASVVSGCDTAPVLELGEEVLHLVALAIEHLVVGVWYLAASAGGNARFDTSCL